MKSLLIASVLALGTVFPLASQAEVSTFGVTIPADSPSVSSTVSSGYVAKSLSDTFQVQKLRAPGESISGNASSNKYYVFGVELDNADRS